LKGGRARGGRVGRGLWVAALLIAVAGLVRIHYADQSRFMAERQYRSGLIARAQYLTHTDAEPEWRREVAAVSAERMGRLEPPVMESLAVLGYRLLGVETLLIPRLLSSLFWLLGGLFVFLLTRQLIQEHAALYALAYYLFLPLGLLVSLSFQPDALMLMLFAAGLWSLVRYEADPSIGRLLATGALFGACVLVKPLCLFGLAGAFVGLRWHRTGVRGLFDGSAVVLGLFVLAPATSYYLYGMLVHGHLAGQAGASFVPALLLQSGFWKETAGTLLFALGAVPLALAAVGAALPRNDAVRPFLAGLLAGHLVLILVFTYHVRMAGHYHLSLAIPVAIGLGAAVAHLVERTKHGAGSPVFRYACLVGAGLVVCAGTARALSTEIRSAPSIVEPAVARAVGEAVDHSVNVVYVSQYYGMPLEYYGELSGWYWPRPGTYVDRAVRGSDARQRSVEERLSNLGTVLATAAPDFRPDYFVVTDFREYSRHGDLAAFVEERCQVLADQPDYLVYGQCLLD
jgi:4-amino-4-deoxy-L-arabinose transferase-like glycosyltransferase